MAERRSMKESRSALASADLSRLVVAVARSRDKDAFAQLFEHFTPRLKTYFLRQGATAVQAEDLAQEILLLVWHRAISFDPTMGSAASWIFTIARNLRIDILRRENRIATAGVEASVPHHEEQTPEQALIAEDAIRQLYCALGELPEDAMRVVRLVYLEENSCTRVVGEIGVPRNTLKSRIYRTLRRLRTTIGDIS